jgi:hypothetical protein
MPDARQGRSESDTAGVATTHWATDKGASWRVADAGVTSLATAAETKPSDSAPSTACRWHRASPANQSTTILVK